MKQASCKAACWFLVWLLQFWRLRRLSSEMSVAVWYTAWCYISEDEFFNFLICMVGEGEVQTGSTWHVGHLLAYCTCPGWLWGWRIWWNEWQRNPKYSEKTCPGATSSTTNPTWPDPGLNPGRRGGKPATNRFSYGAARSEDETLYICRSYKLKP
jgi:hypothetical protein